MDFCQNCGYLLSSSNGKPLCAPCENAHQQQQRLVSAAHNNTKQCDCDYCRNTFDSGANFVVDTYGWVVDVIGADTSSNCNQTSVSENSESWGLVDWGCDKEMAEGDCDGSEQKLQDMEISPVTPKERSPLENLVPNDVRSDWERKQLEYKAQLSMHDTPDIANLVSGRRRKSGNHRFYIGGVDISFIKDNKEDACACLTVIRMPDLKMVYQRMQMIKLTQPYIPGFLAFREVPPLLELFHCLNDWAPQYKPDVVMVDGNGILHPRGFGLASQLGVMLDIPTMGVAKSLISAQGICEDEKHKRKKRELKEAGDGFDLISHTSGEVLGKCIRVHDKAPNPIYISVGHKISLQSAVWLALECCEFRIPEPVRRADLDSREYLRQNKRQVVETIAPIS